MNWRAWSQLIAFVAECDALTAAFNRRFAETDLRAAPAADGAPAALAELHTRIRSRFQALLEAFRGGALDAISDAERRAIAAALVFFVNERVRKQLPVGRRADWVLLRVNDLQVEHGGLLFYELGEELSGADTPALQQVLYFCVSHGFEGRLAGDPAALLDYRQRLRRRVPSSMPARRSSYAGGFTRPLASPVRFYAASSLSVAVFYAALCWFSN